MSAEADQVRFYYAVQNVALLLSTAALVFSLAFAASYVMGFEEGNKAAVVAALVSLAPALLMAFLERVVTLADLASGRTSEER